MRDMVRIIFFLKLCLSTATAGISTTDPTKSDTSIDKNYDGFPNYASLCPYNKLCNSSPRKKIQNAEFVSCCETCSCSPDCDEIGNCCPDMHSAGNTYPKYPCVDLATLWSGVNASNKMKKQNTWFHVITDCPDMISAQENPRCEQPKELQDLIVVSNPADDRVYKNKHCARCNNVENLVSWNLQVECPEVVSFSFETFEERDEYVVEHCSVLPLPPDRMAGDLSRCTLDERIIAECNKTGNWNYFEKEIEQACLGQMVGQNTVFTEDKALGSLKYANVYCYLCNNRQENIKEDICIAESYTEGSKTFLISFTATLEIRQGNSELTKGHCRLYEIWDKFSGVCRKLTCPGTSFPVNGTCRDGLKYSHGHSMKIIAEISTIFGEQAVLDKDLVHKLKSRFQSSVMSDMECGRCETVYLRSNTSSTWLIRLHVYSTKNCSVHDLKTRLHIIAREGGINLKIRYNRENYPIKIRLLFENTELFYTVWTKTNYGHCLDNVETINSSILQYCDSITLTTNEFNALYFNNSEDSMTALSSDHIQDTDNHQVCLESYYQKWEAISGTESVLTRVYYINKIWQLIFISAFCIMQMTLYKF